MSCNKQNRFGKNSKPNKTVKYVDTSSVNTEDIGVHSVFTDDRGSLYVNINIEGKMVRMQVDTGSAKTLLPESLYEKYWSHIMQSQCKLNSYSGQSIPYKGLLTVNVRHDSYCLWQQYSIARTRLDEGCKTKLEYIQNQMF